MLNVMQVIRWTASIAGLVALVLGILHWIANIDFISIHMLFGMIVALTLLVFSIVLLTIREMRLLGVVGIIYALILPAFGLTQDTLLTGSLHWLVQTAHMLVGIGALAFMGSLGVRYVNLKRSNLAGAQQESITQNAR